MSQPAQPGPDANEAPAASKVSVNESAEVAEAAGANAKFRQDMGMPAADNVRDQAPSPEPSAEARLRESTPGFDNVPTNAHDANSSARSIDNLNSGGPVRVREARFSTPDGQTISGNVYPKGNTEVFMSRDGQKYTVDRADSGSISLKPQNGSDAIAVSYQAIGMQRNMPTDRPPPQVVINQAGAAAERAVVQQAQIQQQMQAQQRAEQSRYDRSSDGQPQLSGFNRTERPPDPDGESRARTKVDRSDSYDSTVTGSKSNLQERSVRQDEQNSLQVEQAHGEQPNLHLSQTEQQTANPHNVGVNEVHTAHIVQTPAQEGPGSGPGRVAAPVPMRPPEANDNAPAKPGDKSADKFTETGGGQAVRPQPQVAYANTAAPGVTKFGAALDSQNVKSPDTSVVSPAVIDRALSAIGTGREELAMLEVAGKSSLGGEKKETPAG